MGGTHYPPPPPPPSNGKSPKIPFKNGSKGAKISVFWPKLAVFSVLFPEQNWGIPPTPKQDPDLTLPLIYCAKILMERNLNSVCFSWSAFLQAGIVFDVFQTPTLFRRFQRLFFCGSQTSPAGLSQLLTRGRRKRSSKKTDLLPRKCSYS